MKKNLTPFVIVVSAILGLVSLCALAIYLLIQL
jgi:hypothetical protein